MKTIAIDLFQIQPTSFLKPFYHIESQLPLTLTMKEPPIYQELPTNKINKYITTKLLYFTIYQKSLFTTKIESTTYCLQTPKL